MGTAVVAEKPRGPIPYERHEAVLRNAREQYKWIEEHGDTQTVQQKLAIMRRAEQDPAGFMRDFAAAARLNPHELFGPPPAPPPPPQVVEKPAPDVLLDNGQQVYSDAQTMRLLEWQQTNVLSRIAQEIAPLKQKAAMADMHEQATSRAQQEIAQATQWPGFAEAKGDLAQYLRAHPRATLHDAYIAVVPSRLAASAKSAETRGYDKALADLHTKAGAASAPAPRTATSAGSDAPRTVREALEQALHG
jgi:hypothetical protein